MLTQNYKNILITSAGKRVVLVQIFQNTIRELGINAKVYTTDMKPGLAPACFVSDGYFCVPRCTEDHYIDELFRISGVPELDAIKVIRNAEILHHREASPENMKETVLDILDII